MPALIWLAALLEGLSLLFIQGFLPLYVRRNLGEAHFVTVAAVVAVPAVGTMLASNFWGGVSDVSGRLKPIILVGVLGYAAAIGGFPLLRGGPAVLVFIGLASLFYGTLAPSLKTYVTLARPDRREHALSYLLMAQSVGWLIGSGSGGWLFERGMAPTLRLAAGLCAIVLAAHAAASWRWLADLRRAPLPAREQRGWLANHPHQRDESGAQYEFRRMNRTARPQAIRDQQHPGDACHHGRGRKLQVQQNPGFRHEEVPDIEQHERPATSAPQDQEREEGQGTVMHDQQVNRVPVAAIPEAVQRAKYPADQHAREHEMLGRLAGVETRRDQLHVEIVIGFVIGREDGQKKTKEQRIEQGGKPQHS